jgi:excisionase family DNA binding protein
MPTTETARKTERQRATHSLAEVADLTGTSLTTISKHIQMGLLPTLQIGRRQIVPQTALTQYIDRLEERATQRAEQEQHLEAMLAAGYMTLPQVAVAIGCSRATVYRLARNGELEVEQAGRFRVVSPAALDRFIEQHTSTSAS